MYDRPHYYLTFGGTLLNGAEIWQSGLRFAPDATHTPADLLGALGSISVSDIFEDLRPVIQAPMPIRYANATKLLWAKLAVIQANGEYAGAPKIAEGTAVGTLAAANGTPPQLAWVVSYGTGNSFGLAKHGRQYWPLPIDVLTAINSSTGQVPTATSDAFRDVVKTAMANAEGEVSTVGIPVSAAIMSASGTGTTNFITTVGVGRIVDTQRKRRNALEEGTTTVPATFRRVLADH